MVKVKVIENFSLKEFDKIVNLKRASTGENGKLKVNDEFECTEEMAKYLLGENKYNKPYIEIIEIEPKEKIKKTTKKKTSKK